MTTLVSGLSLLFAIVLFVSGCFQVALSWRTTKTAKTETAKAAIAQATTIAEKSSASTTTARQQSVTGINDAWQALASLATALKDLDTSSRQFVLSLAFLAVAAVAAGVGKIAEAVH